MDDRQASISHSQPVRTQSTPSTLFIPAICLQDVSAHPMGAATPPATPTRSDSVTSPHTRCPSVKPVPSEQHRSEKHTGKEGILEFSTRAGDYEILKGSKLGAGRFSRVYLARGISSIPEDDRRGPLTPPSTPTSPRIAGSWSKPRSAVYAVKTAADKSSINQLRGEARVLSHLVNHQDCDQYIVPFHGFDARRNSLVFAALPATLEDLVNGELQRLDLSSRTAKLSAILPHIARSLISGLAWMHSRGIVHADIKPPNILLRADISVAIPLRDDQHLLDIPFTPVFADFTSSFLITDDPKTISTVGGGTYDYMAPEQLSAPYPLPNFKMDVYALAVSLLQLIIGSSPFKEAGSNRHMKMAMIKEGKPLNWAMRDAIAEARFTAVSEMVLRRHTMDLKALLELGLRKNPAERLDAESWVHLW